MYEYLKKHLREGVVIDPNLGMPTNYKLISHHHGKSNENVFKMNCDQYTCMDSTG